MCAIWTFSWGRSVAGPRVQGPESLIHAGLGCLPKKPGGDSVATAIGDHGPTCPQELGHGPALLRPQALWAGPPLSAPPSATNPRSCYSHSHLPPAKLSSEEYPWLFENRAGRLRRLRSGAARCPASARPLLHLGLLFPFSGTGTSGGSPGLSVPVSLRGPGGRLASRPGLEGEGLGGGGWRQAAEAPQQSSGPCHFASAGPRRRAGDARSVAPPSPKRSWAPASGGRGPPSLRPIAHAQCALRFPQ